MGDFLNDFARYVIGTESELCWLSLRLDEDHWLRWTPKFGQVAKRESRS